MNKTNATILNIAKKYPLGILISAALAVIGILLSSLIPKGLISGGVFALLIGMMINPLIMKKKEYFTSGLDFTSKKFLKLAIIFMGITLSFAQVVEVGKFSLIVMSFTLITAFGFGYLFGKLFKMDWKLSSLISAGTGICGGSAIAAISPVIDAKDSDIAYAMSATFIFDIIMVIVFPILGRAFNMTDMGFGLWAGTAVNDTSSVVAAGYAFSDAAGNYAVIVKLTRTLSIIPIVLIFALINQRLIRKQNLATACNIELEDGVQQVAPKINFIKIFPFFIILFIAMVGIKSSGIVPQQTCDIIASISKFFMVMALGAIGLKTNFKSVFKSGFKPMLHGFIISLLVVVVAFTVQYCFGQL